MTLVKGTVGIKSGRRLRRPLPDAPGVYFFKRGREILYIGKAASLSERVASYFRADAGRSRGPGIAAMTLLADRVSFWRTPSVLEALLWEARLIKRYQPKYNVKEKDDKSFWYLAITKEEWPRVLLVRGKDFPTGAPGLKAIYGPFPRAGEIKAAVKIIRRIFPFRDSCAANSGRPCFNAELGLCPGVCAGTIAAADYRRLIGRLKLFLTHGAAGASRVLKREMNRRAGRQEFEAAALLKRQLFALRHIRDVVLLSRPQAVGESFRIEAYDAAHLSGGAPAGVMVAVADGEPEKSAYRRFKLNGANDSANLAEMIRRRLAHPEWPLPDLVAVDGGPAQVAAARRALREGQSLTPVVGVVKDEFHRPKTIIGDTAHSVGREAAVLLANQEAHRFALSYHRKRRRLML